VSATKRRQPKQGEIESFVIQAIIAYKRLGRIMKHKAKAAGTGRLLEEADGKRGIVAVWLQDG
jgi:hypothetical protein